jgi:copper(I)-binding protein
MRQTPLRLVAAVLTLLVVGLAAGCGDDTEEADTTTTTAQEATTTTMASDGDAAAVTVGDLKISGAWARTSPMKATAGAVYLEIQNTGDADDALVSASVDTSVAAKVELHETKMAGGGMGNGNMPTTTGDAMMMEMVPVDRIEVAAGETVSLKPGGLHIMLLDLAKPLETGSKITVSLTFEQAGKVDVTAEVRDTPPM